MEMVIMVEIYTGISREYKTRKNKPKNLSSLSHIYTISSKPKIKKISLIFVFTVNQYVCQNTYSINIC